MADSIVAPAPGPASVAIVTPGGSNNGVAPSLGSNITSVPTTAIQTNLGIASDGNYGAGTTAAVKAFQTANGLVADGVFGPKTLAAYNNKFNGGSAIVSTDPIHSEAAKNSAALDAALGSFDATYQPPTASNGNLNVTGSGSGTENTTTPAGGITTPDPNASTAGIDISATSTDPFISQLNTIAANADTSTKMLIGQAQTTAANAEAAATKESENYQAGLQLMGIQSGGLAANPTITAGAINQAKSDLSSKISTLEAAKAKAISDADTARDNNDLKTLNQKMAYVKQVQAEQKQALADFQTNLTNQTVKAASDAKAIAGGVYTTMQTLDATDQEAFINAVAQKFNIPAPTLVSALTDYHNTQVKTTLSNDNAQANLNKKNNPTTSSTAGIKAATTEVNNALETGKDANGNKIGNARGADRYVDPSVYIAALKVWPGTQKQFLAAFPVKGNINPSSYSLLPAAIQQSLPKSSSSGRSS